MAPGQFGLLSLAQLISSGYSKYRVRHALECGRLERFLPRVFRVVGAPPSFEQDVMGMVLWSGDGSAASGITAARLHRLPGFGNETVEISTVNGKDGRRPKLQSGRDVRVRRVDGHLLPEIETGTIPLTTIRRTLIDLAGQRHPLVESALDRSLVRERESLGSLWLFVEQEWMRGRRGVRIMRDLLAARTGGQAPSDSESELRARRLIAKEGLPPPVGQHPVRLPFADIHIDLAYPDIKLAIELDSYSWHLNRKAMDSDRERDNALQMLGWVVLRFTWAMLRFDPGYVRQTIRTSFEMLSVATARL